MLETFQKRSLFLMCSLLIAGCSAVVEPISIPTNTPGHDLQEHLDINAFPLTFETARALNAASYPRLVSQPGDGFSASVVREIDIERNNFPPEILDTTYRLGTGDEVGLIQSVDISPTLRPIPSGTLATDLTSPNLQNILSLDGGSEKIIKTRGRVASDGSLLLLGVGRLEAQGRSIPELRDDVRSVLIRDGKAPNFQLEILNFNSQKAYITTDELPNGTQSQIQYVLPITDNGTSLRELIATAGIAFDEKFLTVVKIQRDGQTYSFTLNNLFAEAAPNVYLKDNDHVFIQKLRYVDGKVFLVGGVAPKLLPIQPERRQTLAEALFSPNGPLETSSAQRSAVYLLRGSNPVRAYHLDARNPARILVADAVELRPNDIIFVGEQPINTFNRVLSTIFPLRVLSRDTQNGNLP
jgi:polysaccharide export outer membrane protein